MKKLLYIIWAIAFLLGAFGLYQRLAFGHEPAAYGNRVVWGLWVAMYIYFSGISAGLYLISTLGYVFEIKGFKKIGKLALISAFITLICGLISIGLDLGHMWRAYEVLTRPNLPSSMMAWMIWLYTFYLILLVFQIRMVLTSDSPEMNQEEKSAKEKRIKTLATIGLPLAIVFSGGVGALFGVVSANPMWHSALTPIFFVVGAVASGSALFTVLFAFFWQNKSSEFYNNAIGILSKIVLISVLFDVLLEWAELSIALWMGTPEHTAGFREMLFGEYWFVFWIFHVLLGVIIPVAVLSLNKSPKAIGWASFLVAFTFIGVRLNIVIPGLVTERIHGEASTYIHARLAYHYFPSTMEWLVGIFIISLGIGLFYLGVKKFRITEDKELSNA